MAGSKEVGTDEAWYYSVDSHGALMGYRESAGYHLSFEVSFVVTLLP